MNNYLYNIYVGISITIAAVFGGRTYQTLSSYNYDLKKRGFPNFVWFIDFFHKEKDHCQIAWINWTLIKNYYKKYGMHR